jgi:hypothetical protein
MDLPTFTGEFSGFLDIAFNVGVGESFIIALMVCLFIFERLGNKLKRVIDTWFDKDEKEEVVEKEPNVFWEWIKATHKKMCPMVEFKD